MKHAKPVIAAVLFDFDGTVTTSGHLDFAAVRRAIGCPAGTSLLQHIDSLPPDEKTAAECVLDRFEMEAAEKAQPAPGLMETIAYLDSHGVPRGILTRNTLKAVKRSVQNIPSLALEDFACVITREDEVAVKPEPDGVIEAAARFGVAADRVVVVGDYLYDIEAGRRAGAMTVFVDNLAHRSFPAPDADYVVADLRSLISILHPYLDGARRLGAERQRGCGASRRGT